MTRGRVTRTWLTRLDRGRSESASEVDESDGGVLAGGAYLGRVVLCRPSGGGGGGTLGRAGDGRRLLRDSTWERSGQSEHSNTVRAVRTQ